MAALIRIVSDYFRKLRHRIALAEACGVAGLVGLFCYFLALSWRKWPDPLIDFGTELYLPWRLSEGAVLYRDVDCYYGPLSQYFDAALFTVFGPGLIHLAIANLTIFIGILMMTYFLFRRAWGFSAALTALAIFIAVFGFSQLGEGGNYNYIAPYSQETVHGMFVCLALAVVLARWVETETGAGSFLIGLLFGCTVIIKPEFVLAGMLLILGAAGSKYRLGRPPSLRALGVMAGGGIFPALCFTLYFAAFMPWVDALGAANRGWLNAVTTTRYSGYGFQLENIGLDEPKMRFQRELSSTFNACYFIALIAACGWLADQRVRRWLQLLTVALPAAGLLWLALNGIRWILVGNCLPGLAIIYAVLCVASLFSARLREGDHRAQIARLLVALLASALLARMLLNGRIVQYGYYQAALSAVMVPAILLGELPGRLRVGGKGATAIAIATLALLVPGVVSLCATSGKYLGYKTTPVGTGSDRFYSSRFDQTGALVDSVSEALRMGPRNQTLLVLPEGVMINYLARLPSPIAPFCYFAMATADGREALVVDDLKRHPPDRVVIISRGLLEYGITRYGTESGEGRELLAWVSQNYRVEESKGGDPLDWSKRGVLVLVRK